jgi:hypothetical protein
LAAPFVELKGGDFPALANGAKAAVSQPVQNSGLCRHMIGLDAPLDGDFVVHAA